MKKASKIKLSSIFYKWWFILIPMIGIIAGCYGFFNPSAKQFSLALNLYGIIVNTILFFSLILTKILHSFYLDLTIYDLQKRINLEHEKLFNSLYNNTETNSSANSEKPN